MASCHVEDQSMEPKDVRMSIPQLPQHFWRQYTLYACLVFWLIALLFAIHELNGSVPAMRKQTYWSHVWATPDSHRNSVSVRLASNPGVYGILEYDFQKREIEIRYDRTKPREFIAEGTRFKVARAPSKRRPRKAFFEIDNSPPEPNPWLATEIDERGEIQSSFRFSIGDCLADYPMVLSERFAVAMDLQNIYIVDLASERRDLRSYPFPREYMDQVFQFGTNRFGRVRRIGDKREFEIFEVSRQGDVAKIQSWPVGPKPAFKQPGQLHDSYSTDVSRNRNLLYGRSVMENKIEVHSESGELVSTFEIPGLDLAKGNWDWYENFICWEEKQGELSYFDIEKHVGIQIPSYLSPLSFGKSSRIGINDELVVLGGFMNTNAAALQMIVVNRQTGEIVSKLPQNPDFSYSTMETNGKTSILESGYRWGLSFIKRDIVDGTVIESHFPLKKWLAWIGLVVAATITWAVAWLIYSARNGGSAWMHVSLVGCVLLGIAVWRLQVTGRPYDDSRLPYEYATGVFFGLLALTCMQVASTRKNFVNVILPMCIIIGIGNWLIANMMCERVETNTLVAVSQFSNNSNQRVHVALSLLMATASMVLIACFVLYGLGVRLSRVQKAKPTRDERNSQFSIRNLLLLIVLLALVFQPLGMSQLSVRSFYYVPWSLVISNSAIATLAMSFAIVLALWENPIANCIGWIVTVCILAALLGEFLLDFAVGKSILYVDVLRIVRAILTASAATFIFASRFRMQST